MHPLIGGHLPGVAVTVIGGYPPPWLRQRAAPDFVVTGQVPDVGPYLDRCRLTVAPLRYGAGVKGKVLLSMAHGVPVVASSIAVEGIPVAHGCDALVADDPAGFAAAVAALYRDGALWGRLSENGLRLVGEHFSPAAARAALVELYQMLGLRLATATRE